MEAICIAQAAMDAADVALSRKGGNHKVEALGLVDKEVILLLKVR